jgi:hypothetical protein
MPAAAVSKMVPATIHVRITDPLANGLHAPQPSPNAAHGQVCGKAAARPTFRRAPPLVEVPPPLVQPLHTSMTTLAAKRKVTCWKNAGWRSKHRPSLPSPRSARRTSLVTLKRRQTHSICVICVNHSIEKHFLRIYDERAQSAALQGLLAAGASHLNRKKRAHHERSRSAVATCDCIRCAGLGGVGYDVDRTHGVGR